MQPAAAVPDGGAHVGGQPAGLGKHRPPPPRKRHQGGRAVGARSSTGRGHGGDATDGNADGARHDDGQKVLQQAARL